MTFQDMYEYTLTMLFVGRARDNIYGYWTIRFQLLSIYIYPHGVFSVLVANSISNTLARTC